MINQPTKILLPILALFGHLTLAASVTAAETSRVFRAGAATSNITPPLGAGIVGSGTSAPPSMHIHDELCTR